MAVPASRPFNASTPLRWETLLWIAALLAAATLIACDAARNATHYAKASASYGVAVRAPAVDAASPTGFADGRRTIVYPARWVDGQHWIMQTQQMLARGEWRVRHVDDDNAPFGRAVHWASPFRWWLGLCAEIEHALRDEPIGVAAEHAALFANPALLLLLLVVLVPWVARRFGGLAATFLALAMVGLSPLYVLFAPDNMDHHGLIEVAVLVSLVGLLAGGSGWTRAGDAAVPAPWRWLPTARQARNAFVLSAIAGGFGLWVSAASLISFFAGVGVGALGSAWLGRSAPTFAQFDPNLWRRWGFVGGGTALLCYLAEYFPGHLGWRLEVNHPLYALAWAGAGEVLAQLTRWLARERTVPGTSSWWRLVCGAAAAMLPAAVIGVWGERVFAVGDRFLWSLSNDYTPELQGLPAALLRAGFNLTTVASCLPMLLFVVAAGWLIRRKTPALARAVLAVPFAATALFWAMAIKELRWWTVGFGFLIGVAIVLATLVTQAGLKRKQRLACWAFALALLLPGLVDAVRTIVRTPAFARDDFFSLAERDLAHALRLRAGREPLVVLSAPATTSRLMYFGSAKGLGTAYWENLDGMKRAAAIFAAKTDDEAHALIRAAGVTHIVLLSWDDFVAPYVRLARGLSPGDPIAEPAFGLDLTRSDRLPPWLRRLPDHLPGLPFFKSERVLILEVTDRTQPNQVLVRTARDLLYRGQLTDAQALIPDLERQPDDLAAQVALARILVAARARDALAAVLERIEGLSTQASDLEPEDRVDLIAVLALGGRTNAARAQLADALRHFDAAAVRHLTPGSLANLPALAARLGVPWPDASLQELAQELLPPDRRL